MRGVIILLASVKVGYAQTTIGNAILNGMHLNTGTDPCAGLAIGGTCTGGAIYAGGGYTSVNPIYRYMVTPGGCTDSVCTGAGGTDSVFKAWANNSGTTAQSTITGATDLNNGQTNTSTLVSAPPYYTDTDAAHWCTNMNYGGYSDWYLPAKNELNTVLYANQGALGGFIATYYWSSTEGGPGHAWVQRFNDGVQDNESKTNGHYVRCVRRY